MKTYTVRYVKIPKKNQLQYVEYSKIKIFYSKNRKVYLSFIIVLESRL